MVPESKGFSHISVSPEEEDDLVIQAGALAPTKGSEPLGGVEGEDRSGGGNTRSPNILADADFESQPAAAESALRMESESGAEGIRENVGSHRKAVSETTLADLEGSKMPALQKVIVALAVVSVVGFAVYYVCFM